MDFRSSKCVSWTMILTLAVFVQSIVAGSVSFYDDYQYRFINNYDYKQDETFQCARSWEKCNCFFTAGFENTADCSATELTVIPNGLQIADTL